MHFSSLGQRAQGLSCAEKCRVNCQLGQVLWICGGLASSPADHHQMPGAFQAFVFLPSHTDPTLADDNWAPAFNTEHLVQTDRLETVLMATLLWLTVQTEVIFLPF